MHAQRKVLLHLANLPLNYNVQFDELREFEGGVDSSSVSAYRPCWRANTVDFIQILINSSQV
jgi:hypothetical protein